MGDHFSLFTSWEVFSPLKSKMQVSVLLMSASLVYGAVSPVKREAEAAHHGGHHGYSSGPRCHDKKDHKCHKIPKHEEHDECEHIVETTYIEECEYVTHTHCQEEHTQVHHSSHVVHHDSYGHGYHKREAEADPAHHGYSSGPKCHDKKDKQCHKIPKEQKHKECTKIVDTTYIEECEEIVHTHCEEEHSSHVVGHDTHVEHHGYGGYG